MSAWGPGVTFPIIAGCYIDSQTPGCTISRKICEVHRSVTPYSEASDRPTCQCSCLYTFGFEEQLLSGRQVQLLFFSNRGTSIAFRHLLTKVPDSTNVGRLLHALVANHFILILKFSVCLCVCVCVCVPRNPTFACNYLVCSSELKQATAATVNPHALIC